MKTKLTVKLISVLVALSMVICCMSFAFVDVSAVTVNDKATGSAIAGSVVENDGFTWDNATVYFMLTDRFKNGNTSNDHSYGRTLDKDGKPISGWDTAPGTFHGGDFAGITQAIEEGYFNDLGVNALWISAPYEQTHGYCDSGNGHFAHYSYHGYYVLDYTETDANFGTPEEFETLVDTAHEHGLRVIMDIVMNHCGYNTVADMEEYGFGTLLEGATDYKYVIENVSDFNDHIDYKTSSEDWGKWWGPDWVRSGLPGYTEGGGGNLLMSLAGLPDFKTEQTTPVSIPEILKTKWTKEGTYNEKIEKYGSSNTVTGYITSWLAEWVRKYGVDGFRCDTAKHVEQSSWKQLKTACVDALAEWRQNNPDKPGADWQQDFWMTGEAWDKGVGYDDYYTQGGFDSMINFETWGAGVFASSRVGGLYQRYADEINTKEGFNALSFISSHDALLTRGDTSAMIYNGSAFLLAPGGVQIYYGDESNRPMFDGLSFDGAGGSGHSLRSDMNWDSLDQTVLAHWQKVGQFRNDHVAVGGGSNTMLSATNGVAFARTYDKNGVSDKVAAVIGASSNADITLDVSSIWSDGQQLMNTYDQSSAIVTDGKVTFNSGENGTILIQMPDGKPLMSVKGAAKFKGTQTVTVSLEECDSTTCSIDGGNKFVVTNGTTFEIGKTAYEGDTIKITLEATNEKGSSRAVASFYKMFESEQEPTPSDPDSTVPPQQGKIYVKSDSAPYIYVWTGDSTALCGSWPGTKMTEKNSDGYYVMELNTTDTYNVVLNNGSDAQKSRDFKNLNGDTYLEIPSGNYSAAKVMGGSGDDPSEKSVTFTIKPYSPSASYHLYVWTHDDSLPAGGWPGMKLTEKDADGNYIFTVNGYDKVSAIVGLGSDSKRTQDITGIIDGSCIEITNEDCTTFKLTKPEIVLSKFQTLKKGAREVLAMTSSDYTASSWNNVSAVMTTANELIAQGEGVADEALVESTLESLINAKSALVLANAGLSYAVKGKTTIAGVAVQDADITVTVNGKSYTTHSDEITGEFTVEATALTASSVINVDVERKGLASETYSYNMSNGDITSYIPPTTTQTQPTTTSTTEPTTTSTQPTSSQPTYQMGDVNGDGGIDVADATILQKFINFRPVTIHEEVADVNGDGRIDVRDSTAIQKKVADLSSALG
ncbi:MAG: alpha-amylase family glycosyl hydrolase [Ruminococcus sp.]|nr:alpha-amylase family glycosyl hydrolase [Ruminococcus sp.]